MKKKLLVLGGKPACSCDIVNYARSLGVYVIVTDYLKVENSPAKLLANENWDISTANAERIIELAKQHCVSAVFTGAHEFNINQALYICEELDLPFYATKDQLKLTSDKARYKKLFNEFDIPVVQEYQYSNNKSFNDYSNFLFPVIIKPVDGTGGYGIAISDNLNNLKEGVKKALSFSKSKQLIIERYISGDEVTIFYAIQNGNICLTAMADRHVTNFNSGFIPLPTAYIFPSKYLQKFQDALNKKVIAAFQSVNLQNGMLFIQALVKNGDFFFYDIGFRLTATQEYNLLDKISGINTLKMMVNYALTGQMSEKDIRFTANPEFKQWCCNLTYLAKPGKIKEIKGRDKVQSFPEVVGVVPAYKEGDVIPESALGTLNQVILRVFAIAQTKTKLCNVIDKIHDKISVISTDGSPMLLSPFDTRRLI